MNDEQEPAISDEIPPDAADPAIVKKRQTKAALHYRDVERFWQRVFDDPIGRSEMWLILTECGTFVDRFGASPNGSPDPQATWFHLGQRSFGLKLFRLWAKYAREGVFLMQDENSREFAPPKMPQRDKNG